MSKNSKTKCFLLLTAVFFTLLLAIWFIIPGEITDSSSKLSMICRDFSMEILSNDALTCNYSLIHMEDYGIDEPESTLHYSKNASDKMCLFYENILERLASIDLDELSDEEKMTFLVLKYSLNYAILTNDYFIFDEPLSPVNGVLATLPVLLSEYQFHSPKDIQIYLNILKSIPGYFNEIMTFENEKKAAGLAISHEQCMVVYKQAEDFTCAKDNILITTFNERLNECKDSFDENEYKSLIAANDSIVKNDIVPAVNRLAVFIKDFAPEGGKTHGLAGYDSDRYSTGNADPGSHSTGDADPGSHSTGDADPGSHSTKGKDYYKLLLAYNTGCESSPKDIYTMLNDTLNACVNNMKEIVLNNNDNPENLLQPAIPPVVKIGGSFSYKRIIDYLKNKCSDSFPPLKENHLYEVKNVPRSLADTLSPAMYFIPPVDGPITDRIYVNSKNADLTDIFYTLAHESYPGHMYQTRYYMDTKPDTIRLLLNFSGYMEGWATYAELFSYDYDGLEKTTSDFYKYNKLATLCIYSMADIGIHYYGWTKENCRSFLRKCDIKDKDAADELFLTVASEPALYPRYTVSCIAFINEFKYAKECLGSSFSPKDYHDYLLKLGPAPFNIIHEKITSYCRDRLSK